MAVAAVAVQLVEMLLTTLMVATMAVAVHLRHRASKLQRLHLLSLQEALEEQGFELQEGLVAP
jgi:hypothetical protein